MKNSPFDPPGLYDDAVFPAGTVDRPFVAANFVITADGSARKPGSAYRHFSGPADRRTFRRLRIHFDAILRGARTLEISPQRDLANPAIRAALAKRGRSMPLVVTLSNSGAIDPQSDLVTGSQSGTRALVCVPTKAKLPHRVASDCKVWRFDSDQVDVRSVIERLAVESGVTRVLCEGGPTLLRSLVEQDLLDELLITIAPCLLGDRDALRLLGGATPFEPATVPKLTLVSVLNAGSEVFLRYRVGREKIDLSRRRQNG